MPGHSEGWSCVRHHSRRFSAMANTQCLLNHQMSFRPASWAPMASLTKPAIYGILNTMKVTLTCPICNVQYVTYDHKSKHGRGLTCSYTCGRALAARKLTGPKEQVELQCGYCTKPFALQPNQAKRRKFCSRICSQMAHRDRIKVSCNRCHKTFELSPWQVEKSTTYFCSAACQFPEYMITCEWYDSQKRISPSCARPHNFCSRKCSRAWQGAHGIVGQPYARLQVSCATCGKTFERQRNAVQRVTLQYCSRTCFAEGHRLRMSGDKNPA